MSVRHSAYLVDAPGTAPLGCPSEPSKIFRKEQLDLAKQWARDRAAERGQGAVIYVYGYRGRSKLTGLPLGCPVWQINTVKAKETTIHREMKG